MKRKTSRRRFTLQLYDRIEPLKPRKQVPHKSGGMPQHVREALQGHDLECPYCHNEPECKRYSENQDVSPVHSWTGRSVGVVINGPPTRTLEAYCNDCQANIEFKIFSDGVPHVKSVQISQTQAPWAVR